MKVYCYLEDSKQYWGEQEARESPLEPGVWLLPANATFIKPEVYPQNENEALIFQEGAWVIVNVQTQEPIVEDTRTIEEVRSDLLLKARREFVSFCREHTDDYYLEALADNTEVDISISDIRTAKKQSYESYKSLVTNAFTIEELKSLELQSF